MQNKRSISRIGKCSNQKVTVCEGDNVEKLLNDGCMVYVPKGLCISGDTGLVIKCPDEMDCILYFKSTENPALPFGGYITTGEYTN